MSQKNRQKKDWMDIGKIVAFSLISGILVVMSALSLESRYDYFTGKGIIIIAIFFLIIPVLSTFLFKVRKNESISILSAVGYTILSVFFTIFTFFLGLLFLGKIIGDDWWGVFAASLLTISFTPLALIVDTTLIIVLILYLRNITRMGKIYLKFYSCINRFFRK